MQFYKKFWDRPDQGEYLPVHEVAEELGPADYSCLPFIHFLTEKHVTSLMDGACMLL